MMKTSPRGLSLIREFEGFRGSAYLDPVGVVTIGYGFTEGVKMGDTMTRAQANARLQRELGKYETAVQTAAKECNQNQFDALVCFAWNVGIAGMQKSTVVKAHNRGDYDAAARAFSLWNKAGGKVWPGLVRRRAAEAALYLEPVDDEVTEMPQAVEPESRLRSSPIITGTAGIGTVTVAAEAARSVKDIRDSLGDWLPYIAVGAVLVIGGYIVWQRFRQRLGGWA